MGRDCDKVWSNCLKKIKENITAQSFRTWFEPIKPVKLMGSVLTIQVPNKFFYEWIEENYLDLLSKVLKAELGDKASLEYQILLDNHRKESIDRQGVSSDRPNTAEEIKNPFVIPGIKKIKLNNQLNPKYVFDNFVVGEYNRLAKSAAVEVVNKPGITAFNPLVIYGFTGLGKTHLCHAIGNEIEKRHPQKQVLYVNFEQFTSQVIQAIKDETIADFMNFYQMVDVLIVDDIQYLSKRPKTQEVFFNIFNQLHLSGKQIVLTSDRAPKDIQDVEKRLISRFKWGLNVDMNSPEFTARVNIFKHKMKETGLEIEDELVEYICHNIKNNVRELEGILISLVARASLNQEKINLDLVKAVVAQFVNEDPREITIDAIKKMVADHFDIKVEKLHGKTRKREIVIARQLSMYLAKNFTANSLKSIGSSFGGKDHSTVLYSIKAVQDLMDTDQMFRDTVMELERKVQMSTN